MRSGVAGREVGCTRGATPYALRADPDHSVAIVSRSSWTVAVPVARLALVAQIPRMCRFVALVAFTGLSWPQLVASPCDMGAPGHRQMVAVHGSALGPRRDAPPAHGHHGDACGCPTALVCGAVFARQAQPAGMTRLPALFVAPDLHTATIPATPALAIETPPPRLTV